MLQAEIMVRWFKHMSGQLDALTSAVSKKDDTGTAKALETLASAVGQLKGLEKLKDIRMDSDGIRGAVEKLGRSIGDFSKVAKSSGKEEIKITNAILKKILSDIQNMDRDVDFSEVTEAIRNQSKLFAEQKTFWSGVKQYLKAIAEKEYKEFPTTFKLDEQQMRELRGTLAGGSGGSSGGGGAVPFATGVLVTNVTLVATVENSYAFPQNTVAFYVKPREQSVKIQYAYTSGASNTTYLTIPQNGMMSRPGLDLTGKTIYLYAASNCTAEIEVYQS